MVYSVRNYPLTCSMPMTYEIPQVVTFNSRLTLYSSRANAVSFFIITSKASMSALHVSGNVFFAKQF